MKMSELKFECAPMEGVTDFIFRQMQAKYFASADKYYTPFISPTANHLMTPRQLREILPEHNEGLPVVPQLLGHNAEDFLWAANELKAMGYGEVNFNLGCPSGTVVTKKKGSGFLIDLSELDRFFDEVFSKAELRISVKTRIGLKNSEDFEKILEVYNKYPLAELIVHPRIQAQQYTGKPDMSAWETAVKNCRAPLCYNGDLFDKSAVERFAEKYDSVKSVMLGRGLAANPGLISGIKGEKPDKNAFEAFHNEVFERNRERMGADKPLLLHMKEFWFYYSHSFENVEKPLKAIRKSQNAADYESAVKDFFSKCPLRPEPGFYI